MIGRQVSVFLGGAVAHSAVAVSMLHAVCDQETEKAVRLRTDAGDHIWFPKKALVRQESKYADANLYALARWFRLDARQEKIIDRSLSVGGVSA